MALLLLHLLRLARGGQQRAAAESRVLIEIKKAHFSLLTTEGSLVLVATAKAARRTIMFHSGLLDNYARCGIFNILIDFY